MLDRFAPSYEKQLKSLLQYDYDMHRIETAKSDVSIQNLYHFDPNDLAAKVAIQNYSNRSSIIRLEKKNGCINQSVIPLG
jgi:hypothetical protein